MRGWTTVQVGLVRRAEAPTAFWACQLLQPEGIFLGSGRGQGMTLGPGRPVGQNGGGASLSFSASEHGSPEPAPSAACSLDWWQEWPLLAGRCCGPAFVCLSLSHHAARTDEQWSQARLQTPRLELDKSGIRGASRLPLSPLASLGAFSASVQKSS